MQAQTTDGDLIRQLEEKLLTASMRTSTEAVAELLADEFVEFGSSGRILNKRQILDSLKQDDGRCLRSLCDFETTFLAPGIVLVKYRVLRIVRTSERPVESLRSSIWKLIDGRWQMVFHQGTLSRTHETA
jgi:hypothetical protein